MALHRKYLFQILRNIPYLPPRPENKTKNNGYKKLATKLKLSKVKFIARMHNVTRKLGNIDRYTDLHTNDYEKSSEGFQ